MLDMDLVGWIVVGFIAGFLSGMVVRNRSARGCLPNILIGVLGGLLGGYALALLRHRGQTLDCGCDFAARERPVDLFAILRPVLLALLAAWSGASGPGPWTLEVPFAALALAALWFAAGELHAIPQVRSIRR